VSSVVVGIDLGTTNTVLAWSDPSCSSEPTVFAVPQLVSRSEVEARPLLPSCLYVAADGEDVADPWQEAPWVVGTFAQRRSGEAPGRVVASAKSWLSYAAVDRTAAILPWGATDPGFERLSPIDAATRLLGHVRTTWNSRYSDWPLERQSVVLTVPASFDQAARQLTLEAAVAAGLSVRLLEEPQAAFYDTLCRFGVEALGALVAGRPEALVLVCDVGGGTTDLTLVRVARGIDGKVTLTRVAVGRHLLLGGDNIDLTLAHLCESRLVAEGQHLDPLRFAELVVACRRAKERLLEANAPLEHRVTVLGTGSNLVGGALSTVLTREEVEHIVLDGFFPELGLDAEPRRGRTALLAFGLPYESDPAVTRHVAAFVRRHAPGARGPDALLLNGGLFHAPRIAERVAHVVSSWLERELVTLPLVDPDLAVARGAVAFGLAMAPSSTGSERLRIGGGSAHGYYVGVEAPGKAGAGQARALCVVPRGSQEGERHVALGHEMALKIGETVRFELFASDGPEVHAPGQLVEVPPDFELLPPVMTRFEHEAQPERGEVRVLIEGELSAVGTLDIACVEAHAQGTPRRFELVFELRGQEAGLGRARAVSERPRSSLRALGRRFDEASEALQRVFGKGRDDVSQRQVKDLLRELERLLGERKSWDLELTRALFDIAGPKHRARRRSADHERLYWMLAGYCLRPGFGHPLDPQRVAVIAPLFDEGLAFPQETRSWQQLWIAWRRIAGGLREQLQVSIRDRLDPFFAPAEAKLKKPKSFKPEAQPEMLELVSWLERVPVERRDELGRWLLERTWTKRDPALWRALGRIGARVPAYASVHHVLPPRTVERWLDHLLRERWEELPTAPFAAAQLARVTGDRTRDLGESLRGEVARRLERAGARAEWIRCVREFVPVEEADQAELFGEELPVGLRILGG
jgi:molecular chaperone DnaK (HSP70)